MDKQTILVVDDDQSVLNILSVVLDRAGFHVISAPGSLEALRWIDSNNPIDLLLTDFAMPNMNGAKLAQAALKMLPRLRVLYMTGHLVAAAGGIGIPDGADILNKPFRPSELVARVRGALGSSASAAFCA